MHVEPIKGIYYWQEWLMKLGVTIAGITIQEDRGAKRKNSHSYSEVQLGVEARPCTGRFDPIGYGRCPPFKVPPYAGSQDGTKGTSIISTMFGIGVSP